MFKISKQALVEELASENGCPNKRTKTTDKHRGQGCFANTATRAALGVLFLFGISSPAFAYDITRAGGNALASPYKSITTETTEFITGDTLAFNRNNDGSPVFVVGDTLEISLSGGATFADAVYTLEEDIGGAGTGRLDEAVLQTASPAGKSSITFLLQNGSGTLANAENFILSGAAIAGQRININLPQVPGRDITVTFTYRASGGALKATEQHLIFDNTLPPVGEPESQSAAENVIASHIRNITSQSVGLSGLLTGNGFGPGTNVSGLFGEYGQLGQALVSSANLSLPVSLNIGNGQGDFAVNLKNIKAWDGSLTLDNKDPSSLPTSKPISESDSPFNIWAKGRWQGIIDSRGGTDGDGDFGLFMAGADYRFNEDTLIGVLAQFDLYNQKATGQDSKGKGHGWMVGPYLVSRLDDNLILDVRGAWGLSENKINNMGLGWDEFSGERWQIEANLTGDMEYQNWDIYPKLGVNYFSETQEAFTNSNGIRVSSQTIDFGSLNFGPEVSRDWVASPEITVRPFMALRGIWDFRAPDIDHTDGSSVDTEKLRARVELGGDLNFKENTYLSAKYSFDGIGLADYDAHSVELVASTSLDFGFLPDGSNLKSSFNQSIGGVNAGALTLNLSMPLN